MKFFNNVRKPVRRHTGKCTNTDKPRLQPIQLVHFHLQLLIFRADTLCIREQLHSVACQLNAGFSSFQQNDFPFLFQVVYHTANARLRVIQYFCGFCKASIFDRPDKCHIFLNIHIHVFTLSYLSDFIMFSMINIRFCNYTKHGKLNTQKSQAGV